ncbi:MAG: Ig-like domain-containing protein [Sphingomonas sp.]
MVVAPQAPVAANVALAVAYGSTGTAVPLSLSGGAAAGVAVVQPPQHGTAVAAGTGITYAPASGYSGPDSFTYTPATSPALRRRQR